LYRKRKFEWQPARNLNAQEKLLQAAIDDNECFPAHPAVCVAPKNLAWRPTPIQGLQWIANTLFATDASISRSISSVLYDVPKKLCIGTDRPIYTK
jgi:hypothetical protein